MERIMRWVDVFNDIARRENNFHSFLIEKSEEFVNAVLTLEEVSAKGDCRDGAFAMATVTMTGNRAVLEMSSGTYKKCATQTGYNADYTKSIVEKLDLGNDPELIGFIKSIKNEGDFITLLEAVIQSFSNTST
ncbi:conserved hypothetical protein [Pyrobaculum islandicum DSM 4184]|uniref:Uncharacterized protein n=1 Tax=Pyrobaculum islandicum (strain DSM 4184 / JCM 9189 / GEO3) TaxID=384616 RepID=A1RTX7_PYRIL|nr:hypothetical protein [Pyrobaculum islandicum]ABL88409.1 conserved hypothetical protein [Pyrobaculum islandicum DSM 4184]